MDIQIRKSEFPKIHPKIVTGRLVLREITLEDAPAIFRNFSDPEIAKWFFEQPHTTIEQTLELMEQFKSEFQRGKGLTWAITLAETNQCIGTCGYADLEPGSHGEIGFDLAKEHWRKGYMRESLAAIIDYGFSVLQLSKIEAHTYSHNVRARHLLEKFGFQLDHISEDSHHYFLSGRKA